jgi:glycosyltransferase involved in cell wall biosynthesis
VKILISAYACEPGQGSEPGVGWNFVREMARHHELWVLTQSDGRAAIEAALANHPEPNLHFVFFEPLRWQLDLWEAKAEIQLHYYLWQVQAYFVGRSLHREHHFDLAHHVTFVKYWSPSFLSLLNIPFLWGPVGGGEAAPKAFWRDFGWRGKIYETLRETAQRLGELDPFTVATAKRCVLARATTEDTAKRLRHLGTPKLEVFSEAGLSRQDLADLKQRPLPSGAIRFVSSGRLLHWKGFYLSLQAFVLADIPKAEYWILGDGPERGALQAIAQNSAVAERVRFLGRVDRTEVLSTLAQCHVMVHPSLHDSGGWACLEAMAIGRPVICLNLGGPAVQVTAETGIKVAAQNPTQAIRDIAAAMTRLAGDPALIEQLGQNARQRVETSFSWEGKVKNTSDLYEELVSAKQLVAA